MSDSAALPNVFISYSHVDEVRATELSKKLEAAGIRSFRFTRSVHLGKDVLYEIHEGLRQATHLVILITRAASKSQWVPYEVGYARALGIEVISYITESGLKAPPFLASNNSITNPVGIDKLIQQLTPLPQVLTSPEARTAAIVADLQRLESLSSEALKSSYVWSIATMGSFSITEHDIVKDPYLQPERDTLIKLAGRGCQMQCVISPETRMSWIFDRVRALKSFIGNEEEPALENITWALSQRDESNLLIVSGVSCFLGFKGAHTRGIGVTLRFTDPAMLKSQQDMYKQLFEDLASQTLSKHNIQVPSDATPSERRGYLRMAVKECLTNLLDEHDRGS